MRLLSTLCILAIAAPAFAQDAAPSQDWDLHRDTRRKIVMAFTVYDNNVGLSARCIDGDYSAIVSGLPPAEPGQATRVLGIAFGDDPMVMQRWNVTTDESMAVSEIPAPFARQLREGGRLQILAPDGAGPGRNLRYDLTLPASSTAIDETLTTCGRALVDPRDAEIAALNADGVPANLTWARRPVPDYPDNRYARGFALVSCLTRPDGTLRDCTLESEHPADGGFGDSTLRAARRARLQRTDGSDEPIQAVKVQYRTNFVISGYETRDESSGRREQERLEREERRSARRPS